MSDSDAFGHGGQPADEVDIQPYGAIRDGGGLVGDWPYGAWGGWQGWGWPPGTGYYDNYLNLEVAFDEEGNPAAPEMVRHHRAPFG
jgi:hypothetical protein